MHSTLHISPCCVSILAEKNQNIILFKDTHVFGERRVIYLFNKYDKLVLMFELDLTLKMQEPQWRSGWSYH